MADGYMKDARCPSAPGKHASKPQTAAPTVGAAGIDNAGNSRCRRGRRTGSLVHRGGNADGAAAVESSKDAPEKVKNRANPRPSNGDSGYLSKGNTNSKDDLPHVPCGITHCRRDVGTTRVRGCVTDGGGVRAQWGVTRLQKMRKSSRPGQPGRACRARRGGRRSGWGRQMLCGIRSRTPVADGGRQGPAQPGERGQCCSSS